MTLKSSSFLKCQNMRGGRRGCARFSPIDIFTVSAWFDPTYGLYQERSSPTTLCGDGDPVGTWIARTGQSAIAPSNAARPVYRTNSGKPYLDFDGVDDALVISPYLLAQPFTWIGALQSINTSGGVNDYNFFRDAVGGAVAYANSLDSYNYTLFGGTVLASAVNTTTAMVLTATFNSTSSSIYRNGTSIASGDAGSGEINTSVAIMSNGILTNPTKGNAQDVMFFSAALSDSERTLVEQYLGNRYGITIA